MVSNAPWTSHVPGPLKERNVQYPGPATCNHIDRTIYMHAVGTHGGCNHGECPRWHAHTAWLSLEDTQGQGMVNGLMLGNLLLPLDKRRKWGLLCSPPSSTCACDNLPLRHRP